MTAKLIHGYEVVIGFETHTQLTTSSKIFSRASTAFGAEPNTQACAVDLALPGTLPVMNLGAVERAIRFGLAIGAHVAPRSIFARKNYFYPDIPKGYQISQYDLPLVSGGKLHEVRLRVRRGRSRPATSTAAVACRSRFRPPGRLAPTGRAVSHGPFPHFMGYCPPGHGPLAEGRVTHEFDDKLDAQLRGRFGVVTPGQLEQRRRPLEHLFAHFFGRRIKLAAHQLRQIAIERPHGRADGHVVVVQDDEQSGGRHPAIIEGFKGHARRHSPITNHGYRMALFTFLLGGNGHAQCG